MEFDKDLRQYYYEYAGVGFVWDEEPDETFLDTVKMLSRNYLERLDEIVRFILPDIEETYGQISEEDIRNHLGKPMIDCDNGKVFYLDQTFDDWHIFEFEFLDDKFQNLRYFSMNG